MEQKIIAEMWQAMSLLSDSQEVLDRDAEEANRIINHAKGHLIKGMGLSETKDHAAFFQAMDLAVKGCTLGEDSHYSPQEPLIGTPLEGQSPNPVIALEIVLEDGPVLLWSFEQPLPQPEWFLQMGMLGARFGLGIQITLPDENELPPL